MRKAQPSSQLDPLSSVEKKSPSARENLGARRFQVVQVRDLHLEPEAWDSTNPPERWAVGLCFGGSVPLVGWSHLPFFFFGGSEVFFFWGSCPGLTQRLRAPTGFQKPRGSAPGPVTEIPPPSNSWVLNRGSGKNENLNLRSLCQHRLEGMPRKRRSCAESKAEPSFLQGDLEAVQESLNDGQCHGQSLLQVMFRVLSLVAKIWATQCLGKSGWEVNGSHMSSALHILPSLLPPAQPTMLCCPWTTKTCIGPLLGVRVLAKTKRLSAGDAGLCFWHRTKKALAWRCLSRPRLGRTCCNQMPC